MVLVKTKVRQSGVHGLGLFADQFIPKGTKTFEYIPWFDVSFSEEELVKMSEEARREIIWYAYFDKKNNKYVLCSDDYRFINHSADISKINIESTPDYDIALRDIETGEELLCDYNKFDDTYFARMNLNEKDLI